MDKDCLTFAELPHGTHFVFYGQTGINIKVYCPYPVNRLGYMPTYGHSRGTLHYLQPSDVSKKVNVCSNGGCPCMKIVK